MVSFVSTATANVAALPAAAINRFRGDSTRTSAASTHGTARLVEEDHPAELQGKRAEREEEGRGGRERPAVAQPPAQQVHQRTARDLREQHDLPAHGHPVRHPRNPSVSHAQPAICSHPSGGWSYP